MIARIQETHNERIGSIQIGNYTIYFGGSITEINTLRNKNRRYCLYNTQFNNTKYNAN